uniref:Uncharacterized protein n=1 Tax=Theileria parva TaxID=5875 RepID=Q4N9T8_THEPA|eukprot:XP_765553.1 hypothetical protein [Theileria parva strain Muguga]
MSSGGFIKFLSNNLNTFDEIEITESLVLFFFLENLYHTILPNLKEFSIVDNSTFESLTSNSIFVNSNCTYTSCILFSEGNLLLTGLQKEFIKVLLNSKLPRNEEVLVLFDLLRIFYSSEDGNHYMLVSESVLSGIIKKFSSILENDELKSCSKDTLALAKFKKYLNLVGTKRFLGEISRLNELRGSTYNLIIISICFFLLHINPSFSGVTKRIPKYLNKCNKGDLFNCALIVNNLIRWNPKDSGLWEIKSILTEFWFRKFNIRRSRLLVSKGLFSPKSLESGNILYKLLMKLIYKLFTDPLLLLNKSFIEEILFIKPFNNCVSTYLRHEYNSVVNNVVPIFTERLEKININFVYYNKFREFKYMDVKTRYTITLSNSIFKLFSRFYIRLLRNFSFPNIFILLVNLIKERTYARLSSSVICFNDLFMSSFLYTRVDEDFEGVLRLCDEMITKDAENVWIDNKSKLLFNLVDFKTLLRPLVLILNEYFSTWFTFTDLLDIFCDTSVLNRSVKINKRGNKRKKSKTKLVDHEIDEYKSESIQIRKVINEEGFQNEFGHMDGYGFGNVRYIYLDSKRICKMFSDLQIDLILNSYNQLLYILYHLFRNIRKLNKSLSYDLDLGSFKLLFEAILLASKYSRCVPNLGTKVDVLVGVNMIKKMNRFYKLVFFKYGKLLSVNEHVPYYLDCAVAKLALLILSPLFRFYTHWVISSQAKLELLYRQVLKLK